MSETVNVRRERAKRALHAIVNYLDARNNPSVIHQIQEKRYEAALDAVVELTQISG